MIALVSNIIKSCSDYSFVEHNRILFKYEDFLIVANLSISKYLQDEYKEFFEDFIAGGFRESYLEALPAELIENLEIESLFISDCEYRGARIEYTLSKYSIALRMFLFLSKISEVNPRLITSYKLDLHEGYQAPSEFCPRELNYVFKIYIDYTSPDILSIIKYIAENGIKKVRANDYYHSYLAAYEPLDIRREITIINSNTKVRRLGYLTLLSGFFKSYPKVPAYKINTHFEKYAIGSEKELLAYTNTKGIIKLTKTGISAQPYIYFAKEIEWISKVHTVNIPGKQMKVYQILKSQLENTTNNNFFLTKIDKLFFLETLLSKDFFYFSAVLELIFTAPFGCDYRHLVDKFQAHLLNRLKEIIQNLEYNKDSSNSLRNLKKIRDRIGNWENAPKYLEHVLMPRLNWLFDLDLINFIKNGEKQTFQLTPSGKTLFHHICFWTDINYSFIADANEFLKRFFVHTFDIIYFNAENKSKASEELIRSKINEYIDESFVYFKTLAPNRVTASQAFTFTRYKLYCKDRITVGQDFIETHLREHAQSTFVYKFQKQYNDGYIQKITQ